MTGSNTTLKRAVAFGVALLVVASLGAGSVASMAQDGQEETADVRVAHMSPDAPEVDVLIDNETAVQALSYSDVTEYLELSAGEHQVTLVTADNETEVWTGQISVEAGQRYTVAAIGEVSENGTESFRVTALQDDVEAPSGNDSAVRLFHASPDAGPVDVTVNETGDVLFDNVTFGNATDYVTVPSGSYSLEVRPATETNDGPVVATFNESLLEGNAYTAFAAGYAAPEDAPTSESLSLFLAVDVNGTAEAQTTTTMAEETTEEMAEETTEAVAGETTAEEIAEETTTEA